MLERFTEAARQAIAAAGDVARDSGSDYVEPVHLLCGLAADAGPTGRALEEAGLTGEEVRRAVQARSGDRPAGTSRRMGFTQEASLVIEGSLRLSKQRGAARIDAHDLLLSLLARPDDDVLALFEAAGVDPASISRALAPPEG